MQNVTANAMPLPAGMSPYAAGAQVLPASAPATQPVMVTPQQGVDPAVFAQMQQAYGPQAMPQGAMMPAGAAQSTLGAEGIKPPSTVGSVLKSALVLGGLGAALGAGFGAIPFLPGGLISGAIVGGVAGVLLGAIRGFRSAKRAQDEYKMMMQAAPIDPNTAAGNVPVHTANTGAKKKVVKKKVRTVKVRTGDTLAVIAKRHKTTVKKLHDLNRGVIGSNPSKIKVGVTLKLPTTK